MSTTFHIKLMDGKPYYAANGQALLIDDSAASPVQARPPLETVL
jgi:hypothetical protein